MCVRGSSDSCSMLEEKKSGVLNLVGVETGSLQKYFSVSSIIWLWSTPPLALIIILLLVYLEFMNSTISALVILGIVVSSPLTKLPMLWLLNAVFCMFSYSKYWGFCSSNSFSLIMLFFVSMCGSRFDQSKRIQTLVLYF